MNINNYFQSAVLITKEGVSGIKIREDIDNDHVVVRDTYLPLFDYHQNLFNTGHKKNILIENQIIPKNCKFIESSNSALLLAIEQEPQVRQITTNMESLRLDKYYPTTLYHKLETSGKLELFNIDIKKYKETPFTFELAFPYVVFFILIYTDKYYPNIINSNVYVYFRGNEITSFDDMLYYPNLTNLFWGDSRVCMDRTFEERMHDYFHKNKFNLCNYIDIVTNNFWVSTFNNDLHDRIDLYLAHPEIEINNFYEWQYYTQKDPRFILGCKFLPEKDHDGNPLTVKKVIKRLKDCGSFKRGKTDGLGEFFREFETPFIKKNKCEIDENKIIQEIFYTLELNGNFYTEGDNIYVNDKIYFFNKRIEVEDINGIKMKKYIEVENIDGRKMKWRLTERLIDHIVINEENRKKIYEITDVTGEQLKIGDAVTYCEAVKLVKNINKRKDGLIEIYLNNYSYIYDFIKHKVKKFDEYTFQTQNCKLISGEKYSYFYRKNGIVINKGIIKFNKVFLTKDDQIKLLFEDINTSEEIEIDKISSRIFISEKDIIEKSTIIKSLSSINKLIIFNEDNEKDQFVIGSDIFLSENNYDNLFEGLHRNINNISDIKDYILFENETSLYIPDFIPDNTINLKIGDDVITTVNFSNDPDSIFVKYKIHSFDYISNPNVFYIVLQDYENNLFNIPFIELDYEGNYFRFKINNGIIRRYINLYDDLRVGDKFKLENKVPGFYKKDIITLMAILDDVPQTEEHLEENGKLCLFSNYCTLYSNTLKSNFSITDKKQTKVDVNNNFVQPGDMLLIDDDLNSVTKYYSKNTQEITNLNRLIIKNRFINDNDEITSTYSGIGYYSSDIEKSIKYSQMYGIPSPRNSERNRDIRLNSFYNTVIPFYY